MQTLCVLHHLEVGPNQDVNPWILWSAQALTSWNSSFSALVGDGDSKKFTHSYECYTHIHKGA